MELIMCLDVEKDYYSGGLGMEYFWIFGLCLESRFNKF